jgi:hypothetical protein
MLAFQRSDAGAAMIYLAQADGSGAQPLVPGHSPAFAPGGQKIVFVRSAGLFVTTTSPSSPVLQLTNHPGDRTPAWSSTGSIAFERTDIWNVKRRGHSERHVRSEIDLITPPSLHVRQILTWDKSVYMWPDWSPDGKTLTLELCNGMPPHEPEVEPEPPKLEYRSACNPSVWAPEGRWIGRHPSLGDGVGAGQVSVVGGRFAEIPDGSYTVQHAGPSCPLTWASGAGISWQPLFAGTLRIHTAPCEYKGFFTGVAPATAELNEAQPHRTRSCTYRHHKRHCRG